MNGTKTKDGNGHPSLKSKLENGSFHGYDRLENSESFWKTKRFHSYGSIQNPTRMCFARVAGCRSRRPAGVPAAQRACRSPAAAGAARAGLAQRRRRWRLRRLLLLLLLLLLLPSRPGRRRAGRRRAGREQPARCCSPRARRAYKRALIGLSFCCHLTSHLISHLIGTWSIEVDWTAHMAW